MFDADIVSKDIYNAVTNNKKVIYKHKSVVVIGDNASGKTTLVKRLLKTIVDENNNDFYFIDSLNRVVYSSESINQGTGRRYSDYTAYTILKERAAPSHFSKEDVFPHSEKGGLVTYSELMDNLDDYEVLFNKFFDCTFKVFNVTGKNTPINGTNLLQINDSSIDSLASSEAARIRLIMEIENASVQKCKMVIIDELDNCFDPTETVRFIEKLQENYPELRFLFVVHNFSLLVDLSGLDAVICNNERTSPEKIHIVDCNDITAIGEIDRIRAKYIRSVDTTEMFLSECVASCVRMGTIDDSQKKQLGEIERNSLNVKSKVLFDYILEIIANESSTKD